MKTIKEALWEIVSDENIIITNQNIDWLLDRASKKATGDAQALKESILERKRVIEENIPCALTSEEKVSEKVKQIEEMAKVIEEASCGYGVDGCYNCEFDGTEDFSCAEMRIAIALYNAGYRKQSKGEWKKPSRYSEPICTICKKSPCQYFGMLPPFCPNCGAKMKGGEE